MLNLRHARIIRKILNAITDFQTARGTRPVKVHLTRSDEEELWNLSSLEVSEDIARQVARGGIRSLTHIDGVAIQWDAKTFGLEGPNGEMIFPTE